MMVSQYDETHTLIVLQRDHSEVAGLLAAHWGNETFARPNPYHSLVLAANEHDKDWDWENTPTVGDDGRPIDYIGSAGGALGWPTWYAKLVQHVIEQDQYAGLMVSMHGVGLVNGGCGVLPHMPDRGNDSPNREFIAEQAVRQRRVLEELRRSEAYRDAASEEQVWTNYKLLQVFDQLGQILCNRYPLNSPARRNGPPLVLHNVPVAPGKDDTTLTVDVLDERRARVQPYPFDLDPLDIPIWARLLPNRRYESREEYFRDFYRATRIMVTYVLMAAQ